LSQKPAFGKRPCRLMRRAGARAPKNKNFNLLIFIVFFQKNPTSTFSEIDFSPGENLPYFDVASM
jgi:hypothetical protein